MIKNYRFIAFILGLLCFNTSFSQDAKVIKLPIIVGAEKMSQYLPALLNKRVGVVANQSSLIQNTSLVDSLVNLKMKVTTIFCPEHGFRGNADAGEHIGNGKDKKTGLTIISLYGKNKKPKPLDLKNIDIIVFDLQDVGARFYTYISTLHYMMEACAEKKIKLIVLDRPNPNGYYVDGPLMQKCCTSFVGMHQVPIVHGMTIGEYAQMINTEKWLANGVTCDLSIVTCDNYNHKLIYTLPIKPSPNIPNARAVFLYPSLCLFEGTVISVGRGTDKPFQQIGHPLLAGDISFKPIATIGSSNPLYKDEVCFGFDFSQSDNSSDTLLQDKINISLLINIYELYPTKDTFFTNYFKLLVGNEILENQIKSGISEAEIRKGWEHDLLQFKTTRKKYLLYPDFE